MCIFFHHRRHQAVTFEAKDTQLLRSFLLLNTHQKTLFQNQHKKSCTHPSAIVHQSWFFWVNLYLSTHQTRHLYKIVAAFCCVLLLLLFYMYNTRKVFMFSDICIKEHKIFIYFTIMVVRSRRVYTHRDGWCTLEKRSYSTHFLDSFLSQVFILIASLCQEHNRTDISKTNQEKKWKKWKY